MCGIIVKTGKNNPGTINAALSSLSKRGPDDSGIEIYSNCVLGHTRLSIVDLSQGHQPMVDSSKPLAITFNGEIYNYKQLRNDLKSKGHIFKTQSDTEVILKSYIEYGDECVKYFDGMFSFAIWDEENQNLFFARDRFGKKPLYYSYNESRELCIASEIKALVELGIKPKMDPSGIDAYLTLMYVPPWRTIYKNIQTLLPSHTGNYRLGEMKINQYWKLEKKPITNISFDESKEEVKRLLLNSVESRMIADVEIGAFLSGGVDSTLITAYAQKFTKNKIKTFSLGYGDHINELPFADMAAKTIGTEHYAMQANSALTDEIESFLTYFDEPHGDSADLAQHLLSRFTASKVKVALAGDGGDELFMGYGWYWAYWNRPKIVTLKNKFFSDQFSEHIKSVTIFPANFRKTLLNKGGGSFNSITTDDFEKNGIIDGIEQINDYDIEAYLPGQLLTKVDRTSMMHSLEVRCPLLDHHLAEFVYNLPTEYKMNKNTGKFVLKDLLSEIMPRDFVDRKKQGFGAPVRMWVQEKNFQEYIKSVFFNESATLYNYLNKDVVKTLVTNTLNGGKQKSYYQVWVLLCLAVWMEKHNYE